MTASSSPSRLVSLLHPILSDTEVSINADCDFQASAAKTTLVFAIKSSDSKDAIIITIEKGTARLSQGEPSAASFTLSSRPEDWENFFQAIPSPPFQSFWGILRVFGHINGVGILGDLTSFGRNARIWRLVLDNLRSTLHNQIVEDEGLYGTETDSEEIVGGYVWIDLGIWGRARIFHESAGSGPQTLLLLHTAGADSRQQHGLMNNTKLQQKFKMVAFDLPSHGRSSPTSKHRPQGYTNCEDFYIKCVAQVINKLGITAPIISGASMAGHICLALAMKAAELKIYGVIPCEGCDHIPFTQPSYELSGDLNESLLHPERVCGMIAPTAPPSNKRLIWWIYSSQGVGVFSGDLNFYFRGWDGRDRLQTIDTTVCPVYMLTGEYDYSCRWEDSKATAKKIPGAKFEKMIGLGHFPATEDPDAFVPYLLTAVEFIQAEHASILKATKTAA